MKKNLKHGNIQQVCISRNGANCKSCPYYGIMCANWLKTHKNSKPCEYDVYKHDVMRDFFGDRKPLGYTPKITKEKETLKNGNYKKKIQRIRGNKT